MSFIFIILAFQSFFSSSILSATRYFLPKKLVLFALKLRSAAGVPGDIPARPPDAHVRFGVKAELGGENAPLLLGEMGEATLMGGAGALSALKIQMSSKTATKMRATNSQESDAEGGASS